MQICILALLTLIARVAFCDEPVAKQFLKYTYGAEGIDAAKICLPSDDLWMLQGALNPNALKALEAEEFPSTNRNVVVSGVLAANMYFVEVRNGQIDPSFNLASVYSQHRSLLLTFVYACLKHDKSMLERLTTDASKVEIVGPRPPSGEMGHYESVIEAIPVVRSSKSADDSKSKTVTYRLPLGDDGLTLTLVNKGNTWKIDSSKKVKVSLEFFFK